MLAQRRLTQNLKKSRRKERFLFRVTATGTVTSCDTQDVQSPKLKCLLRTENLIIIVWLWSSHVGVEHLFQKVANLHDLRFKMTDFSWLYSENLAKFHRGKCRKRQITLSFFWHIRENCRYFYLHSAVKLQQPMLGGVEGCDYPRDGCVVGETRRGNAYIHRSKLFQMPEFILTSLSLLFLASLEYYGRGKTSPFQK